MLNFTLLKTGLKACFKNLKSGVITFVIGFILFLFIQNQLNHKAVVRELEWQNTNLQEIAFLEAKKDSTASIVKAKELKTLKGLYQSQTEFTLWWRKQALELQAKQDTTTEGRVRVSFAKDNECLFLKGYTLTATEQDTAEARILDLTIKPITIKNDYMIVGKDVYSIVTPSNPYFKVKNHISLIPPEYIKPGSGGIPLKWIIPSVGLGILIGKAF